MGMKATPPPEEFEFDIPRKSNHYHSNPFAQDVGSFQGGGQPPETTHSSTTHTNTNTANQQSNESDFETRGSMDMMMKLHNDPEVNKDGAVISMERSDLNLYCSVPSISGSGNFFGMFTGNTGFMKQRGFGTSTLSLGYRIWDGAAALLYDWNTADGLSKSSYGASYESGSSKTKAKIHYPCAIKSAVEPSILSLHNCTKLNDKLSTEVEIGIAAPTNQTNGKHATLSSFRMGIKTIHNNLGLPHVQIYLDFFHQIPLKLCYQQPINQSEQSSAEVSFGVGKNRYEVKALLSRSLDQFSKFSIGAGHSTWAGLSWIVRLQKGDLCLNVPIQITSLATSHTAGYYYGPLIYSISTAYVSLLSGVIHTIMGEVLARTRVAVSSDMKREEKMLSVAKAREDAESQITLMKRKADANRRSEESKGGLVIVKATYGVEGDSSNPCLDVCIPLQFWVAESRLKLAASSFGSMLGFYDIGRDQCSLSSVEMSSSQTSGSGSGGSLIRLWNCLFEDGSKDGIRIPVLYVRYKFNERTFDVTTLDNEALILPNPRAIEIKD